MSKPDLVILGGGPAGLGAALVAARSGARVTLVEAGPVVGGLCVTRGHDGMRYDLGGHIPFVRDAARLEWLHGLVGEQLAWVSRPVASVRGGRVRPGRYLDQRPPGWVGNGTREPGPGESAEDVLSAMVGRAFMDTEMRGYLEKVDGLPLSRIPGTRPLRLMNDQAAPAGFWYPQEGIGSLMDAMSEAARAAGAEVLSGTRATAVGIDGGRVRFVDVESPAGRQRLDAPRLVVAIPAALAARLAGVAPEGDAPPPMRAVCLVFLAIPGSALTDEAWVQVDDPRVPFSRVMEVGNWSPRMAPPGVAVLGMECYCTADPDHPLWGLDDEALGTACAAALHSPLGWLDDPARARLLEVVRMPRAYPLPDMAHVPAAQETLARLQEIGGVHVAPGADVVAAIEAGERAARQALA